MRTLEQLKDYVRTNTTTCDLVEAIIFKAEIDKIPKSQSFFQQTFFELKRIQPTLFEEFIFDESPAIPFSDELDNVINRLEASAILSTLNPSYKNYVITNSPQHLEACYEKFADKIDVLSAINSCAELFSTRVNAQI